LLYITVEVSLMQGLICVYLCWGRCRGVDWTTDTRTAHTHSHVQTNRTQRHTQTNKQTNWIPTRWNFWRINSESGCM